MKPTYITMPPKLRRDRVRTWFMRLAFAGRRCIVAGEIDSRSGNVYLYQPSNRKSGAA